MRCFGRHSYTNVVIKTKISSDELYNCMTFRNFANGAAPTPSSRDGTRPPHSLSPRSYPGSPVPCPGGRERQCPSAPTDSGIPHRLPSRSPCPCGNQPVSASPRRAVASADYGVFSFSFSSFVSSFSFSFSSLFSSTFSSSSLGFADVSI